MNVLGNLDFSSMLLRSSRRKAIQQVGAHQLATQLLALHPARQHTLSAPTRAQHFFVKVGGGPGDHLSHPAAVADP